MVLASLIVATVTSIVTIFTIVTIATTVFTVVPKVTILVIIVAAEYYQYHLPSATAILTLSASVIAVYPILFLFSLFLLLSSRSSLSYSLVT